MKIGILLTKAKSEKKKDELVPINSPKRPWLKDTPLKYTILNRNMQRCTPGDVSVGMYIKWNYNNVEIDFIYPEEIDVKRLNQNDINFMLIYDLLEAFHVDDKKVFGKFKNALKKCHNIYPPYYYQKFINNKCSYINHLSKFKQPVIPTCCIMSDTYQRIGFGKAKKRLLKTMEKEKWGDRYIGKPVYGQESIFFKKFQKGQDKSLEKYMKTGFGRYPGLIFQKYIEGFDAKNPEIRLYFINGDYKYSIITNDKTVRLPKQEFGTQPVDNLQSLIKKGKEIIRCLPEIKMKGVKLPRLLTRIDISCEKNCRKPWIINEIEFVPSLYIEDIRFIPEPDLGDTMMKIAKNFSKK